MDLISRQECTKLSALVSLLVARARIVVWGGWWAWQADVRKERGKKNPQTHTYAQPRFNPLSADFREKIQLQSSVKIILLSSVNDM